jgi:D-sedoheptulose 7-phosphate isomerase
MPTNANDLLEDLILRYPVLAPCREDIRRACDALCRCHREGGTILVCGNGGSAADAEHIVGELMKGFLLKRKISAADAKEIQIYWGEEGGSLASRLQQSIRAISLVSQSSLISAVCNDTGADMVYAQQVYGYGREGDVVLGISTSGNAANVNLALKTARALEMTTIGLTGRTGGSMKDLCHIAVCVPSEETFKIQEFHTAVYHALCAMVEHEVFWG